MECCPYTCKIRLSDNFEKEVEDGDGPWLIDFCVPDGGEIMMSFNVLFVNHF